MTRENNNILRLKDVRKRAPLDRSTIYRKMQKGTFPQSVPLSMDQRGHVTAVGWYEADINAWVADPTGWRPDDSTAQIEDIANKVSRTLAEAYPASIATPELAKRITMAVLEVLEAHDDLHRDR